MGLISLHTGQFVVKLVGKYQVKDVNNADFFFRGYLERPRPVPDWKSILPTKNFSQVH